MAQYESCFANQDYFGFYADQRKDSSQYLMNMLCKQSVMTESGSLLKPLKSISSRNLYKKRNKFVYIKKGYLPQTI